uniref:Uncharacterized protein n=1 Tax=Anopheles coluzzii TaxID=1518534 RepID=A0A8W7P0R8_ANOCL
MPVPASSSSVIVDRSANRASMVLAGRAISLRAYGRRTIAKPKPSGWARVLPDQLVTFAPKPPPVNGRQPLDASDANESESGLLLMLLVAHRPSDKAARTILTGYGRCDRRTKACARSRRSLRSAAARSLRRRNQERSTSAM